MTLAEMAAAAARADGRDPWQCRMCGCKDWKVVNSHIRGGVRKRQRVCRHCGEVLPTIEIPDISGDVTTDSNSD